MTAPKTDRWRAIEEHWDLAGAAASLPGKPSDVVKKLLKPQDLIVVTGLVTLGNTNLDPDLAERKPQGINPAILQLDLTIEQHGVGTPVVHQQLATFLKPVKHGQYKRVEVFYGRTRIADVAVKRGADLPERKLVAPKAGPGKAPSKTPSKAKPPAKPKPAAAKPKPAAKAKPPAAKAKAPAKASKKASKQKQPA